jgi:CRISPR-associated exonuclease Cas4
MTGAVIETGALYYGAQHKRHDVVFDTALRKETALTAARLHDLIRSGKTPAARYEKKCERCSLVDVCLPKAKGKVSEYLISAFAEKEKENNNSPLDVWSGDTAKREG